MPSIAPAPAAIPGPHLLRVLARFEELVKDPRRMADQMDARYGPVARIPLGPHQVVLLNDPALTAELVHRHDDDVVKDDITRKLSRVLGDGLLTSSNPKWRAHRRLIAPSFTPRQLGGYAEVMVAHAHALADRLPHGRVPDLRDALMELTLEVVCACLFGGATDGASKVIGAALNGLLDRFSDEQHTWRRILPEWALELGRRSYESHIEALDGLLMNLITAHKQRDDPAAADLLLGRLLAARDEAGRGFTDQELRDEAVTLFAAGAETTALALTYTLVLLGESPAARDRLEAELAEVLGDRDPTMADLKALPYLDAVVSESLRLYPPAWGIGRRAVRDFTLGPWQIRTDDTLLILPWTLHRDPTWYDAPTRFSPERWLDGLDKRLPRYAYMPFGAGPRVCVGNHFARMEVALVLAVLLRRLRFDVPDDLTLTLEPSVTLRPTGPVPMRVSPRPRSPPPPDAR